MINVNPLFDINFLTGLLESQEREIYARITALTQNEMPIEYIDERRSSILAADYMTETGTFGKKRKESVDTLSAQIILQTYLDRIRK